jgi:flagellar P-ring protein precursor FlgI
MTSPFLNSILSPLARTRIRVWRRGLVVAATCVAIMLPAPCCMARTQLRSICRLKGQEENVLVGQGLVVGLNGTGADNDFATMAAVNQAMTKLGNPISMTGRSDKESLKELSKLKGAAVVMVSATVPATGSRRGSRLNCTVAGLAGKSLEGGWLVFANLRGPNPSDPTVYATCNGALVIDQPAQPMTARITGGCQMQQDVYTKFVSEDGYITLVLDHNHADFALADSIAAQIRQEYESIVEVEEGEDGEDAGLDLVHAIDASNIRIKIPDTYANDTVAFAILESEVYDAEPEARVVINPRTGMVSISGDVEIGDVVIAHSNMVVAAVGVAGPVGLSSEGTSPKLEKLVEALNALKVPAADMIEIIREIEKTGKLHGKLIER